MLDKHQLQGIEDRARYYLQIGHLGNGEYREATKSERILAKDIRKLLIEIEFLNQVVREQIKTEHPEFNEDEIDTWLCWLKVKQDRAEVFQALADSGD